MRDLLSRLLSERSHLVADGAMATNLMAAGLGLDRAPELWNEDEPEIVRRLHDEFVAAGADVLLTNSFGANACRLRRVGAERRVRALNRAAGALARGAATDADRAIVVAGAIGPIGEPIRPHGALDAAAAQRIFAEQAQALAAGGVDVLWLETFTTLTELGAALDAAADTALPIVATLTFGAAGNTLSGETAEAVAAFFRTRARRPLAIGANCGTGPGPVIEALRALRAEDPGVETFVAKSNCGVPERVDGRLVYPDSPAVMAQVARLARDAGARIIGGCCGATPAHVRAIAAALAGYEPAALSPSEVEALLAPRSTGRRAPSDNC